MIDELFPHQNLKKRKSASYMWDIEQDNGKCFQ